MLEGSFSPAGIIPYAPARVKMNFLCPPWVKHFTRRTAGVLSTAGTESAGGENTQKAPGGAAFLRLLPVFTLRLWCGER